jgi:bis(5'-nucleosyl)-tetraphosphatase (symmetrical)
MTTYAIGDIQGCYDEMRTLLDQVDFDPALDRLWLVGDLINKGPKNLETLRYIKSLGKRAKTVLGNHDRHFLAVVHGIRRPSRRDTFHDLLNAPDLDELVDWVRTRPLLHHSKKRNYTMAHAGLAPQWNLKKASSLAREVEKQLSSDKYVKYLAHMYGDKPDRWRDDLEGFDRFRVIINYFTRLRYCRKNGAAEFLHKENVTPRGYKPWFQHERRNHDGLRIVIGHWASLNGRTNCQNVIALDTGCVWGRALTLMDLKNQKRYSCDCQRSSSA